MACRPGAGGGARRAAGHDGRGHADPGFGGDKAARGTEDPGPPTFATCPGLESEEENQLLLQDWTTGELKKRKRQTRPREVRARRGENSRGKAASGAARPRPGPRGRGTNRHLPRLPNRQSTARRPSFAAAPRPLSRDREGLWERRGRGGREKEARTRCWGRAEAASGAPGSRRGGERRD